jgi:hypothetical protein
MTQVPDAIAALFTSSTSSGRPWLRQLLEVEFRRGGARLPPLLDKWLTELEAEQRTGRLFGGNGPDDDLGETLSVSEFAQMTGTTVQAVRARCRRGTLPAARTDSGWRIYPQELPR